MENRKFRFKKFECAHESSSMKIGVDAVLLGAWTDLSDVETILDVGTGCGVISLMCAQRNGSCRITAIDIHSGSVSEASRNFINSPWCLRLHAYKLDYRDIKPNRILIDSEIPAKFDLIISNPPYFASGISEISTPRMAARHEGGLSPCLLLEYGRELLNPCGRVDMVVPYERGEGIITQGLHFGYELKRALAIKGHPDAPVKRLLLSFKIGNNQHNDETERGVYAIKSILPEMILETSPGEPTAEHRELCKDFYLKF